MVYMLQLDELRRTARERLSPERYLHTLGTEREAAALALRHGADAESARAAALLHDITKELTLAQQLKICARYDIMSDVRDLESESAYHAITAAAAARYEYNMPEDIVSAIRWHTTGRANMSLLEKIIFTADYIEPSRPCFEGLAQIRGLAYNNLDEAVLFASRATILHLLGKQKHIGADTLDAYNYQLKLLK